MANRQRRWRPDPLSWIIVFVGMVGLVVLVYPSMAQWVTSYNQSRVLHDYVQTAPQVDDEREALMQVAREYNEALNSSAVLSAHASVPEGTGLSTHTGLDYQLLLSSAENPTMARLRYAEVGVDLPIYHGTSDETLLRGAGHLEGTHLPIGGADSHSVITAHRGLADATMFTNLDRARVSDVFSIEVLGQTFAYRVSEVRVVEPDQNDALRVTPGQDLVTLVTCTPLGINSHRILVTGERIIPTPASVTDLAGAPSELPGSPWWLAALAAGATVCAVYLRSAGYSDLRRRSAATLDSAPKEHLHTK